MMAFLLPLLSFGKGIFGTVGAWLSKRSLGEVIGIALAIALAIDHIALLAAHRHERKSDAQLVKQDAQIKALAAQSKVKQQQVTKTVDHYITVTKPVIQKEIETIEAAPLPGNCKTPKEISDADV